MDDNGGAYLRMKSAEARAAAKIEQALQDGYVNAVPYQPGEINTGFIVTQGANTTAPLMKFRSKVEIPVGQESYRWPEIGLSIDHIGDGWVNIGLMDEGAYQTFDIRWDQIEDIITVLQFFREKYKNG